jgi:hypothetical protein
MNRSLKTKDWPISNRGSGRVSELEGALTEALKESTAELSERFNVIIRRYKEKKIDQHA